MNRTGSRNPDPTAVSVYPGPGAGFEDPWVSACGECGTSLGGLTCWGCGQQVGAGDGTVVLDSGLVGLVASDDPAYLSTWGLVS